MLTNTYTQQIAPVTHTVMEYQTDTAGQILNRKMISDIYSQDMYNKGYYNKSEQNGKLCEKRTTKLCRSEHFINLIIRAVGL